MYGIHMLRARKLENVVTISITTVGNCKRIAVTHVLFGRTRATVVVLLQRSPLKPT